MTRAPDALSVGDVVRSKYTGQELHVARVTERFVYVNKLEGKPWKNNSRMRHGDVVPTGENLLTTLETAPPISVEPKP